MPEPSTTDAYIVRFGLFELNLRSGELRKAGTRINLQEQPLRVLTVLLDRPARAMNCGSGSGRATRSSISTTA